MKYLLFLFAIILSCGKSLDVKINHLINEINSSNILLFKNISVNTRDKDKDTGDYLIVSFTFFQIGNNNLNLPPIDKIQLINDSNRKFQHDIKEFGKINGVGEEEALELYQTHFKQVSELFKKTKACEVYNNPNLGDFTLFRIDSKTDLIYLNDPYNVKSEYWKHYFKNAQPFRKNWYLKREKK